MILHQILSWGYTATAMVEVQYNFYGQHIGKSDAYHLEEFNKGLYGLAIVYPLALTFSKLSLLALYWRIFRVTTARFPLQIVAALNIAWMLAAVGTVAIFLVDKSIPDDDTDPCRHIQLHTCSGILESVNPKPLHQVSCVLHFQRGVHNRSRFGGSTDARVFHCSTSAISVSKNFY